MTTVVRACAALVIFLGVAAGAAGCVHSPAGTASERAAGPVASASAQVVSGKATGLRVPGGASVRLPAGTVRVQAAHATLTARAITPPKPAPAGMMLLGRTWDVEISGGKLDGVATLRLPVPAIGGTPGGSQPDAVMVAYLDPATGAWTPVSASYDAAAREAVVRTPHLSVWSLLSAPLDALAAAARHLLAELFGVNSAAPQPSCPGASTAAAAGIRVTSSSGGLVKWCAGEQGGQAVLRVSNNRSFGIEVDYPWAWTASRDGWPDIDTAIADGMASLLTFAPQGEKKAIIGGGDTVTFTIPLGASGTATATPSSQAYLWSALVYGLGTLVQTTEAVPLAASATISTQVKAVQLVFSSKDCLSSFQGLAGTAVTSVSGAAGLFWQDLQLASSCLGDEWEKAYGAKAGVASYLVDVFLWLVNGLQLVGGGVYGLIESGVYWNGYQMAVTAPAPPPTLGLPWPPASKGYGTVRPPVVFNGGDPTGLVSGISWSSWGGPAATGTGTALYVGPTQTVPQGTEEQATIVAFNLGTCDGQPAYTAIRWYFPGEGETFSPAAYINACTHAYVGNWNT